MAGGVPAGRLNIEIVADIARLQADLDKTKRLVKAASGDIADSARYANDNIASMGKGLTGLGNTSKLAGYQMQNLAFQMNDVVVGLASGQKPMTVFMQQGAQIGQIAMQAGVGLGAMAKQALAAGYNIAKAGVIAVATNPYLLAIAAAAITIAGGVGFLTDEINKNSKVTVTWKDVVLGAFDVAKSYVSGALTSAFSYFGTTTVDVWNMVVKGAKWAINWLIGAWSLVPRMIITAFQVLPAGIADLFYSAVNGGIHAINGLVEKAVSLLNSFANHVNPLLSKAGLAIPTILTPKIGDLQNNYAGAATKAGKAFVTTLTDTVTRDFIGQGAAYLKDAAVARAKKRMEDDAEKAGKSAGAKAGKAMSDAAAKAIAGGAAEIEKAFLASLTAGRDFVDKLNAETRAMQMTAIQLKQLAIDTEVARLVTDALSASTDEQRKALLEQADAVKKAGAIYIQVAEATQAIGAMKPLVADEGLDPEKAIKDQEQALRDYLDLLDTVASGTRDAANGMADAFGSVGKAIGDMAAIWATYAADREDAQQRIDKAANPAELAAAQLHANHLQIKSYGDLAQAAEGFFKKGTTGYKVMHAAEQAFRLMEFAMSVKSIIMKTAETSSKVVLNETQQASNVATGASAMFASLGPWGFAAVAAMMAVMIGLGFKGGGGTSGYVPPSSEDVQKSIGTGTVLGSSDAQSASLANALTILSANSNKDLEYSNAQVGYLRDIASGIGSLTALIGRQIGMSSGMFSTGSFGLGTSSSGIQGLFGSTTTKSLYDQGLQTFGQTVNDILMQGVNAQVYSVIETVKKSSGFLGLGGGTSTTYTTINGAAPGDITTQMQKVVASINDSVVGIAVQLGFNLTEAINRVGAMPIPQETLSFVGMSADDIDKALQAYFSEIADRIASSLDPVVPLQALQKAGEGLYETLTRLAKDISTVDVGLTSINMTSLTDQIKNRVGAQNFGYSAMGGASNLVDQFGGLDAFQQAIQDFSDGFLTDAEKMAPVITAVNAEMARLGESSNTTKDQFKALVQGLDLSTDAGQAMFAQLLAVAPAFAKVQDYFDKLNGTLNDTGKTAAQLAEIEKQRQSLQIDLMTAQGDAAGALAAKRAMDLAAMDESLRSLQQLVWTTQDAAKAQSDLDAATALAAATAEALAKTRAGLEIDLMNAQGDAVGALAAQRALELAALDPSLRALKEQIYAVQDAATAADALAKATQDQADAAQAAADAAKQIATERRGIEIELMTATGDAVGALAAQRADELAALDASNRALKQQVYDAQDAAAAAQALADAQQAQADSAKAIAQQTHDLTLRYLDLTDASAALAMRRADELASTDATNQALLRLIYAAEDAKSAIDGVTGALAKETHDLTLRLLDLTDATAALNMRRADEIAATDATNQALLQQIYTAEDLATAAKNAADAQDVAKRAMEAAQQAADEAARAAADLANKKANLEIQLMTATGDAAGALAAQRALELAALDPSLRALQEQVYAAQDAATANDALTKAQTEQAQKVTDARSILTDSYNREAGALSDTIKKFSDFSASLREFRATLTGGGGAVGAYRRAQAEFVDTASAARMGDATALGSLAKVSQTFLDASKSRATSELEYQRDVSRVARAVDAGIGASDHAVDVAQGQLDALTSLVSQFVTLNKIEISVLDAIRGVQDALSGQSQADPVPVQITTPVTSTPVITTTDNGETAALRQEVVTLNQKVEMLLTQIVVNTGKAGRALDAARRPNALAIVTDPTVPIQAEISST